MNPLTTIIESRQAKLKQACGDILGDPIAGFNADTIRLILQTVKEKMEGARIECLNHGTDPQNGQPIECYGYDENFNSALDAQITFIQEGLNEIVK